jgi:hypothetical protein
VEIQLEPIASEDAESAYLVKVDEVVLGRVERHKELVRLRPSESEPLTTKLLTPLRRPNLWLGIVDCSDLDEQETRSVQRHAQLSQTTHLAAAHHLVEAFAAAGVAIPRLPA